MRERYRTASSSDRPLGTQAPRRLNLNAQLLTQKAGGTPAYPGPVAAARGCGNVIRFRAPRFSTARDSIIPSGYRSHKLLNES